MDSLPVLGARGVVRLEPLGQREQARAVQHGGRARAEPAHQPARRRHARAQRARPRRVPRHRAPHHVAHGEAIYGDQLVSSAPRCTLYPPYPLHPQHPPSGVLVHGLFINRHLNLN